MLILGRCLRRLLVLVAGVLGRRFGGGRGIFGRSRCQRLGLVVALAPTREHLDGAGHDLSLPVARSTVVVPLASLEPALDEDLLALPEELTADLGQAVPNDHVVIFGPFFAVSTELVGGDDELRHR